jgi:serine O-acetyltransferase
MFENVTRDLGRCGLTRREQLREVLFNRGTWAVLGYRFRRWLYTRRLPHPLGWVLNWFAAFVEVATEVLTGIELPPSVEVGAGLYIAHGGTLVVASKAVLGANCTLTHGVTIGHRGGGRQKGDCPVIGDRVYIGPGAAVVGPITVSEDALIGVGAVVVRSVPPRAVVAGNPARVLSLKGSFDLVEYAGMESDPARNASLADAGTAAATSPSACPEPAPGHPSAELPLAS